MVKRVSLVDVARAAGVAKATASRALSGRDDVGAATRARILDIASDLGYHPHQGAQALRTGRFHVLAVSLPLGDPAAGELLRGAALRAAEHGYQILIDSDRLSGRDLVLTERFGGMAVDGVLVLGDVEPGAETGSADRPLMVLSAARVSVHDVAAAIDELATRVAGSTEPQGPVVVGAGPEHLQQSPRTAPLGRARRGARPVPAARSVQPSSEQGQASGAGGIPTAGVPVF